MEKNAYLEKRNALIRDAEDLVNAGELEKFAEKTREIEELDKTFEIESKALASLNALRSNPAVREDLVNTAQNTNNSNKVEMDETEVYRVAFAKTLMGRVVTAEEQAVIDRVNHDFRIRMQNSAMQTTADSALLIPETVKEGIWREIGEQHPIFGDLRGTSALTFVQGDFTIIVEKPDSLATDAAGYDEEDEIGDDDKVKLGEINLTGCELAKAVTVSWKAKKMSVDAFLQYITTKIAEKMGNTLAKWIVKGLGKGDGHKDQCYGIVTRLLDEVDTPQVVTYTDKSEIDYDFMTDVMAVIKSGYLTGAKIYANNLFIWGVLAKIKDQVGRPYFVPDPTSSGVGRIFGLVVKEEDAIDDNCMLIGNAPKGYGMNINEDVSMYREEHVKARKTDYMGYAIVDGDVVTTKAFAYVMPEDE